MKYTDDTIMTHGKHKFVKLCRVPPQYLLNVFDNNSDKDLCEYVRENLERIIMRRDGLIEPPPITPTCNKIAYVSKKEANAVLAKISAMEQDHKKPVRSYECDKCFGWHLTSRP
jgi:hypothetical protein